MQKHFDPAGLRNQFSGCNTIDSNYAQADQDIFVLSMLNGKRNGTWLEIGCAWPQKISNTALLEQFGWSGLSIDSYQTVINQWPGIRTTVPVHQCAYKANWIELLHQKGITQTDIDYLSLDCDPAEQTLDILHRIPFDRLRFAVITFEHDCYAAGPAVKIASRQYLCNYGYKLVASNISDWGQARDYEDWWVHPDLVSADLINMHTATDKSIKPYETYLYGLAWSDQFAQNRL
jgi:hypothetical protein